MFEDLKDDILKNIFQMKDEDLTIYIKKNNINNHGNLHHFKDHAFAEYWTRQIKNKKVSKEDIHSIISFKGIYLTDFLLGEIAKNDLLIDKNYSGLISFVAPNEWAFNQISSRIEVENFKAKYNNSNKYSDSDIKSIFEKLILYNTPWAIEELIVYCDDEYLKSFIESIYEKKVFSRRARHIIKDCVRDELKKRNSKIKID